MKSKLIKVLKGVFYVVLFCTVYVGITSYVESGKREAIIELESQTKLDSLVKNLLVKTFKDSLKITNYDGFSAAIDSIQFNFIITNHSKHS